MNFSDYDLKTALPRYSYIAYHLQKIELKGKNSNIDRSNFVDCCVKTYENLNKQRIKAI